MIKYFVGLSLLLVLFSSCLKLNHQELEVDGKSANHYFAEGEKATANGAVIQSFNSHMKYWFGCGDVEASLENGAFKAEFVEARFACIGGKPLTNDLSDKQVIVMRIKAISETFNEPMTVKFRIEDMNGYETNYDEQVYTFDVNKEYIDFELDFRGRLLAVNGNFDQENVVKVKAFFNVKGSSPFTGTVYIDEIRAKPYPAK